MTKIKVELFHADWCGHCKNFLPEWKRFAEKMKTDEHVEVAAYESNSKNFNSIAKINGEVIKGYPTIKITANGNEIEYSGGRTVNALTNAVNKFKDTQHGGANKTDPTLFIRKPMMGGSVNNTAQVTVQNTVMVPSRSDPDYSRKILEYKIAKYEYKYDQLYNDLRNRGIL